MCGFNSVKIFAFVCIMFSLQVIFSCELKKGQYENYFCYNESSGITSLDPAFAKNQSNIWAVHQLYNTLVETGPDMHVIPSLARSWQLSEDRLTIEFILRDDVFFHDHPAFPEGKGRKMTAFDVEYSLRRLIDPEVASPGAWIFNGRVDTEKGFEAVNDTVFRLRLLKPFVQMLGVLSNAYCSVVPKEVVEWNRDAFRKHPCGTGPFRFFLWEDGQVLLMKKNPVYFEKDSLGERLPYLDGVKISFLSAKSGEFLEFQQKRLDFMNDIDPAFKDEILTKRGVLHKEWENKIVLYKHPYLNVEYLGILIDTTSEVGRISPLRNKMLRQAVNYAIDRPKLMLYLRNSIGRPAEYGFIPPGLPGFDSTLLKGYTFQPELARSLVKQAGFNETAPPFIKLFTIPVYADLANALVKDLNNCGMKAEVEVVQKSVLLTKTANSQVPFFRASWIADYPDAENFMGLFYSLYPAPPNYTRYKNNYFDDLYHRCLTETNDSIRVKLYKQMDAIIIQDAPVVPLWYDEVVNFLQPSITGFIPNALNIPDLRKVKKEVGGKN
jgi:peptide/nickel transport system substrate-binding protein